MKEQTYDFILNGMTYSYSSINTYQQCPYAFKLSYLNNVPKVNNAFAQFGGFIHDILEKYFSGELMVWELSDYFKDNYGKKVRLTFPPNRYVDLAQSYYDFGLTFFEDFDFPFEDYEIFSIEKTIKFASGKNKLTARPDLILTNRESGDKILFDYKTERVKTTKKDKSKQLEKVMRQMQLYVYALWVDSNIEIDEMRIWFVRDGIFHSEKVDAGNIAIAMAWVSETIDEIQSETEWSPTNTKENEFFCRYLCGVRNHCKYIDNPAP